MLTDRFTARSLSPVTQTANFVPGGTPIRSDARGDTSARFCTLPNSACSPVMNNLVSRPLGIARLERTSSGWWLCGDISKTRTLGHKVPITEEVARIVLAQRELVRQRFTATENPQRYLFPSARRYLLKKRWRLTRMLPSAALPLDLG